MHHRPRRNTVLLALVPLLVVVACVTYPHIQYFRNVRYLNDFTTTLGLSEQDRLTPPYRYCYDIFPKCGVYITYQTTKTPKQLRDDLTVFGNTNAFELALTGTTMVGSLNAPGVGRFSIDGKILMSSDTTLEKLPDGLWLSFLDMNKRKFSIEYYDTDSLPYVYALGRKRIQGNVITIKLWD